MQTKEYREKNRERIIKKQSEYREKNREQLRLRAKKYREDYPEKIAEYNRMSRIKNKESILVKEKEYRRNNREILSVKKKEYYENNKERLLQLSKEYRKNNRVRLLEYHKEYIRERRRTDSNFRISASLRARLWSALQAQGLRNKENQTMSYVGCSKEELRTHLEKQFKEGMSWENYGEWHIDHVYPISRFDLTKEEEIHKAMHYSNLQPLWKEENMKKKDTIL